MFKKILVAEDFDTYNVAIAAALESLDVKESKHVSYCDEALLQLKRALADGQSFDLLITDLSFKPDHKKTSIDDGIGLITEARKLSPDLSILTYSVENRMHPIRHLLDVLKIDGYVLKGRNNIPELRKAIQSIYDGTRYFSPEIARLQQQLSLDEIEDFDIRLLNLLADGQSQSEIAEAFQHQGIVPNSISSIEKRLNRLKTILGARNNVQLVVISKDLGLL